VDITRAKRLFFVALIASLSATAGLAIIVLLFAELDETTGRILGTTALLSLFSLLGLPAGVLLDQGRFVWLAWTVIVLAGVAFALAMVLVWGPSDDDGEAVWKALAVVAAFAGASSQAAATTSRLRPAEPLAVRVLYAVALGLGVLFALLVTTAALAEVDDENFYRGLGALAVADLLFVVLQPIARRAAGVARPGERRAHRLVFTLDREPPEEAIRAASEALRHAGVLVERVERRG
jgi:hypothetical protein